MKLFNIAHLWKPPRLFRSRRTPSAHVAECRSGRDFPDRQVYFYM